MPELPDPKLRTKWERILKRSGLGALGKLGGVAYDDAIGVRARVRLKAEPDPKIIGEVAKALKIPKRSVRMIRQEVERFMQSEEYRAQVARSETLRPPQADIDIYKPRRIAKGPNGRPVTIRVGSIIKHTEIETCLPGARGTQFSRYRAFAWEGDPRDVEDGRSAVFMAVRHFAEWVCREQPRIRPSTLDRHVKVAVWCLYLESPWRTDPITPDN